MGAAISNPDARWTAAVVPYDTRLLTTFFLDAVNQAIRFYEQYTGFYFVEITKENASQFKRFIQFKIDKVFPIAGNKQEGNIRVIHINSDMKDDGGLVTHMLHEMGHALGLLHEQKRPDRNDFVVYFPQNVKGKKDSFTKVSWDEVVLPTPHDRTLWIRSYDYSSRMQYQPTGKGGGKFTLRVKEPNPPEFIAVMGASKLLSRRDVATLNYIADPLLGGALTSGTWETIDDGHQLVPYGDDLIIDWETDTGKYRVWRFSADANGHENPLMHSDMPNGSFPLTDDGHQLIAVDDALLIDWHPDSGAFRLWDPARPSIKTGHWETIGDDHHLVALGGHRLLDWDDDGNYRLWVFDQTDSKLLSGPQAKGQWQNIDGDHELVLLSDGNILDHNDDEYRIFAVNREAQGGDNPLTHVLAAGTWQTIDDDHTLVPIGKHRVIDWEPDSGAFRVWSYAAKFDAYPPDPRISTSHNGKHPSLVGAKALELEEGHLLTWNDSGDCWLWRINYGVTDALELMGTKKRFSHDITDMTGHQLVALPGMRVLDFDSKNKNTGSVYEYQLDKPLLWKRSVTSYPFEKINNNHRLIRLSGDLILDWVPAEIPGDSQFDVWEYNASAKGKDNPFKPKSKKDKFPKSKGTWHTISGQMIGDRNELLPLDNGQVIDWVAGANFFRIWQLAIDREDASILMLPTLAEGFWNDLDKTTQIVPLAGARILEWDAQGGYRISDIVVTPTPAIPK
jgi:hypothetical protein